MKQGDFEGIGKITGSFDILKGIISHCFHFENSELHGATCYSLVGRYGPHSPLWIYFF